MAAAVEARPEKVKYMTRQHFLMLRRIEEGRGKPFNRAASDKLLRRMSKDLKFPIGFSMIHNDTEMRCSVGVANRRDGRDLVTVWVDMPMEFWAGLPEVEVAGDRA